MKGLGNNGLVHSGLAPINPLADKLSTRAIMEQIQLALANDNLEDALAHAGWLEPAVRKETIYRIQRFGKNALDPQLK